MVNNNKPMTVEELIEALQKIEDKTLEVSTEGCDCYGDVGSVTVEYDYVCLKRV